MTPEENTLAIIKAAMGNSPDYVSAKASLLSALTIVYCMAETIPDAIDDFRADIPNMEKGIRSVFGSVDQMCVQGREFKANGGR